MINKLVPKLKTGAFVAASLSMGFTGYYGVVTAGDGLIAQGLGGAMGVFVSAMVPVCWMLAGFAYTRGLMVMAALFSFLGSGFGVLDAYSNTGAMFYMKDSERLFAQHSNKVATDRRASVAELKKQLSIIENGIAARATLKSPGFYVNEVKRLQATTDQGRSVWKRTKGCAEGEVTYEVSKVTCQAIRVAQSSAAEARELVQLREDRKRVFARLQAASKKAEEAPGEVSAVMVISDKVGALWHRNLKIGNDQKEFIYLWAVAIFGSALTVGASILGFSYTWVGSIVGFQEDDPQEVAKNKWIPDDTRPAQMTRKLHVHSDNPPSPPHTAPGETVVFVPESERPKWNSDRLQELMQRAQSLREELA